MNIRDSLSTLLLEFSKQSIAGIDDILFEKITLTESSAKVKDGVISIKAEFQWSFPNIKKPYDEVRETAKTKIAPSKKFKDAFCDYLYETYSWLNKNNKKEKQMYTIEVKDDRNETVVKKNEFNDRIYCYTTGLITFDMAEWWTKSIVDGKTDKALFFKDYKIRYSWEVNALIKKVSSWKEKAIECLKYALFNKSELKSHMKELTGLPMDSTKVDFDITFNDTQNEIKLVLLRGIVKWLKKFGIPGSFSKWIITGLSIYGVLKLLKDHDKDDWENARSKIDRFMD